MENIVITVARQYGSGGKTIGEIFAKEMGSDPPHDDGRLHRRCDPAVQQ